MPTEKIAASTRGSSCRSRAAGLSVARPHRSPPDQAPVQASDGAMADSELGEPAVRDLDGARGQQRPAVPLRLLDVQLTSGPPVVELPGGDGRTADVPSTVQQRSWDPGKPVRVREDTLPTGQETVLRPVVRHQGAEVEPDARVIVQELAGRSEVSERDVDGLPTGFPAASQYNRTPLVSRVVSS